MLMLKRKSKGAHIESKRGKDISIQVTNLAHAVRILYVLVRKCSRPKAHS